MNRKIRAFVYSLDLKNKMVKEAVNNLSLSDGAEDIYFDQVKKIVDGCSNRIGEDSLESISVDRKEGELLLTINNPPQKGGKSQEVVSSIFGLENPVFFMARVQIVLGKPENA
jgi:hypothetical protein